MEWNEENICILRCLWAEGLSTVEIARRFGISKNAVVGKANRLNLPPRKGEQRNNAYVSKQCLATPEPAPLVSLDYASFLEGKRPITLSSGISPGDMPGHLFDYQRDVTAFCLHQGRAALFLDTGLGKTSCILEWCKQSADASNGYALILTPLAVAKQFEREAVRWGYDARVVRAQSDVMPGINICNYDRLDLLDASSFGAVALDESSILKNFSGKTTRQLIETFSATRFRLCATATPAPNDHMELGNHAEFLGIMSSQEMLARWFINDTATASQKWRLKRSAVNDFWDWVASWSRCAQTPDDLGYDGSAFNLPELVVVRHRAEGGNIAPVGSLFAEEVSATTMHATKRQTASARAKSAADIISESPDEPWIIWVDTDYEAKEVRDLIPGVIEVSGSMKPEKKEDAIEKFLGGGILLTKPSVCGAGLNFQHCSRQMYVGRSFSYEAFYQSVRRSWRFGQKRGVVVHIIVADGEDQIGRVIDAKAGEHTTMKRAMADAMKRTFSANQGARIKYQPEHIGAFPLWLKSAA